MKERHVQPDAVLEVPGVRRRLFLECETGSRKIAKGSDPNSTIAKAERYTAFISGLCDRAGKITFYQRAFPDGWDGEVLFLVMTEARRDHVNQALTDWRHTQSSGAIPARALLVAEAAAELREHIGSPAPKRASARMNLGPPELEALRRWYNDCVDVIHRMRDLVRERAAQGDASFPLPEYPHNLDEVRALLGRLASSHSVEGEPWQS